MATQDRIAAAVPARTRVNRRLVMAGAALALAAAVPFVARNFLIFQLTMVMIYAIAILGLNLLTGFNGQFSLGHSAFFALGAYGAAVMMEFGGIPYIWAILLAGVIGFAAGFLFGLPALRLEGIYLALATFALAVATPQFLKLTPLTPWTGGSMGLFLAKPAAPFGLPLNPDQWCYFLTLAIGVALYIGARNLIASRTGRAFMAIRDNPIAARAMGINVALVKSLAFGVSAFYGAVAGALAALVVEFVSPDSFTFILAVNLLVGLVIGGVGWLPGAVIGGAFVMFVPTVAERISRGLPGAVAGAILITLIALMPSGAGGLFHTVAKKMKRKPRP